MSVESKARCAVVVGLCAHGLAITRALHRAGVDVVAIEADMSLPGTKTACARVVQVRDINGPPMIETLVELRKTLPGSERLVLFLTNDRMVRIAGEHLPVLESHYQVRWAEGGAALLPFLNKNAIERRCREVGLNYPRTRLVTERGTVVAEAESLRPPFIVKPVQPLSRFKTLVADTTRELASHVELLEESLPVLVQEFIPGTDRSIRFGALYLRNGEVLARFEGRKLRSRPMGHTTIAVSEPSDEIHTLARHFFAGMRISGPVSLELKQARDGSQWVIEPTVGRTDFWVGLCISNGVNLPLVEFENAVPKPAPRQIQECVWMNGERDPGAFFWLLAHAPSVALGKRPRGVFLDFADPMPFVHHIRRTCVGLPSRAARWIGRRWFAREQRT